MFLFIFFEPTPFAGSVIKEHKNINFCYILITREFAKYQKAKILTAHPCSNLAKLYSDYDEGFEAIDWETLEKRDYKDERSKQICMAEVLVKDVVYAREFKCIIVKDEECKNIVMDLAKRHKINVECIVVNYIFPRASLKTSLA